jgi:hypothetical protein
MTKALPALARQEALFVGEGAALPARIRIRTLADEQCPKSSDISFSQGWVQDRLSMDQLETIAGRLSKASAPATPEPKSTTVKAPKAAKTTKEDKEPF